MEHRFIAGFRHEGVLINPIDARNDLLKAIRHEEFINPSATPAHLIDTNNWNVEHVLDMTDMFADTQFNNPINGWNVSNVTTMECMFSESSFNLPLANWNVSNVTNMNAMFYESQYNHPLNREQPIGWNVGNVTNMNQMFFGSRYNHPLNNWDVSNVINVSQMFEGSLYNHPLDDWDIRAETNMHDTFECSDIDTIPDWWIEPPMSDDYVVNHPELYGHLPWDEPEEYGYLAHRIPFRYRPEEGQIEQIIAEPEEYGHLPWDEPEEYGYLAEYVPAELIPNPVAPVAPVAPFINPVEIHNAFSKINIPVLNGLLDIGKNPEPFQSMQYVYQHLRKLVDLINDGPIKQILRDKIELIYTHRLQHLSMANFSPDNLTAISLTLIFMEHQHPDIIETYLKSFTTDCTEAYDVPHGMAADDAEQTTMSCAQGVIERIISSMKDAFVGQSSSPLKEIYMVVVGPEIIIPELIIEWFNLYQPPDKKVFPKGTTPKHRQTDLANYLLSFFPTENKLIKVKTGEVLDSGMLDDEYFDDETDTHVINVVTTKKGTELYDPSTLVYDKTTGKMQTIEYLLKNDANIIILIASTSGVLNGFVTTLLKLQSSVREIVECNDKTPPEIWEDYSIYKKKGGKELTIIPGPEGENLFTEKPGWFYDGPVPFDRVFKAHHIQGNTITKFMTTKLLRQSSLSPKTGPGLTVSGEFRCNQPDGSNEPVYTLVGLVNKKEQKGSGQKKTIKVKKSLPSRKCKLKIKSHNKTHKNNKNRCSSMKKIIK